ncbi:SpoIIE family protein phosphatase [Streptomyces sp. NPDC000880]
MVADREDFTRRVMRARERMLAGEPMRKDVRGPIFTSWQRCQSLGLPADRLELPYRPDEVDLDGRLLHAARPVLDRLESMLAGTRMSAILTDGDARIVQRRAGDHMLNDSLDAISLTVGFSYAEDFAGTNGIGSALTERSAYSVIGTEHFSERLQPFSCVGTPVRDPFTGRIVGIIDLTCLRAETNPAMSDVSRQAAADIEQRMLELGSEAERALLREYFRTGAGTRPSGVIIRGEPSGTAADTEALTALSPDDHLVLNTMAAEMISEGRRKANEVPLSRGRVATLLCRPVTSESGIPGAVVEVRVWDTAPALEVSGLTAVRPAAGDGGHGAVPAALPTRRSVDATSPPSGSPVAGPTTTTAPPPAFPAAPEDTPGDVWLLIAGESNVGRLAAEARQRLNLLYQASVCVGTTLDVTRTVEELAELVVPRFADIITVDLLDLLVPGEDSGATPLRRTAVRGAGPGMPFHLAGHPVAFASRTPQAESLTSGRAVLERDPARMAAGSGQDRGPVRSAPVAGAHSMIAAPLRARGAVLGLVTFYRVGSPTPYDEDDLALAEELTARTALAVDNARRFTHERETALALQQSLLPHDFPELSAVEVARRYLPSHASVGGDWFDVIPLSGSRVALVVGDVVGHGVHAAATMGLLRTAVRNFATLELAPSELLASLDDLVGNLDRADGSGNGDGLIGATCLYIVYDPVSQRCTMARAGHLLPALVDPGGGVRFLELPAGPPLGLGGLPFESVELGVPEGSLLALYTDGLVEARDHGIDIGLGLLAKALDQPASSLEDTCQAVIEALLPARPRDDVALLIARTRALDTEQVATWDVPFDPAAVAPVRADVTRTLLGWGLEDMTFAAEVVVSELVANAVRHARGPLRLRLIRDDTNRTLIYEMSDGSLSSPRLRRAASTDEGGRGLFLVANLTERWGTRSTEQGKTIWAEQPLPTAQRLSEPRPRRQTAPTGMPVQQSTTGLW